MSRCFLRCRRMLRGLSGGWVVAAVAMAAVAWPTVAAAATLTASLNIRPNMALYVPGETVQIQFNVTGATVGWQLKLTVKDEHEAVIATKNYNITSSTWSTTYTAPSPKLGFYRVYASLYNGSSEVKKLTAPNSTRLDGYLTYAIVPDPSQRPASIPDTQAAFGMQGGFHQNVGTDIFALLGVRWNVDGGWKWKSLSPSVSQKFTGANPPSPMHPWATDGDGGPWTIYNMPNLTKDGRPYGGNPDVYKPGTFAYNTGALRPEYEPDWQDFCEAVAASWPTVYPNRSQPIYEITWEPIWDWGYKGTDEDLVRLYELAHDAISAEDPDAWVMGPCMHINRTGNLAAIYDLFDLGLGNYIDAFSAHPYMDTDNGWNLRAPELAGQPSLIRTMKNKLREYVGHDIPMLGTEQGYRTRVTRRPVVQPALGTQPDLTAELRQARRLIRSNLLTLGEGWRLNVAFYVADYPTTDNLNGNDYWDWGFFYNLNTATSGGYGPDKISPKPIVPAYAAMTFLLENRKSVCDINWLGDSVRGYAFQHYDDDQDVVLALWNFQPTGTSADEVTIDTGVSQVEVYDWMGNKTTQSTSGGLLTVALDEEPIYIKGVDAARWGSARPDYNVARGKSVTVSSQAGGGNPGSLAVDGDSVSYLSRWVSQSGFAAQWIEIDLGGSHEINGVRFWTGEYAIGSNGPLGQNTYQDPLPSYNIQRWNGSGWTNIVSRTGNTKAVVNETFSPVTTSRVRLYVPASTVDAVKLYEIEVLSTTPISSGGVVDLAPVADSYVQSGTPSTNYGSSANLVVKSDWSGSTSNRDTYLRFDLSGIGGDITDAKLILHPTTVDMPTTHQLHLVSSDTWGESTITWSNKPAASGAAVAEWSPNAGQEVQVDVTSLAQAEQAGDGKLSLRLHAKYWDATYAVYGSRNHGTASLRPVLRVTSEPPPPIVLTPVADAQVQAGTGASTNFGSAATMRARYDGPGSNNTFDSFLRFDLSSLPATIQQAKLVLYPTQLTIWQNPPVHRLQRVGSDSWNESTITYNNKPASDSTVLGQWDPVQGVPVEIDITSTVQSERNGDGVLSLRVYGVNWDGANTWYGTRENAVAAHRPKLVIQP